MFLNKMCPVKDISYNQASLVVFRIGGPRGTAKETNLDNLGLGIQDAFILTGVLIWRVLGFSAQV